MNDKEFIEKFRKIKMSNICRNIGVNHSNLCHKKISNENAKLVREEIESELAKLYIKEN